MAFADYPVQSLMYITNRPEIVFTEGKGSWLTDHNGKRYLDFVQGWAVNCLGHSNDGMIEALNAQAKKLINPSPAFYNEPMAKLAGLLTAHSCFDKVFFANSGAEANEGAIKLARKWGKKHKNGAFQIITFDHSFHGRTLATMSASGKAGWDTIFAPQVPGFPKAILNDIASVEALITDETVGVMLEPVQGEGGVLPATPEFMQQLRALTKKHKILLIVDEVQAGCGRCGTLFAYQLSNIEPDIMTLGKGIGGGVHTGKQWTEHIRYWQRDVLDGVGVAPAVPEGSDQRAPVSRSTRSRATPVRPTHSRARRRTRRSETRASAGRSPAVCQASVAGSIPPECACAA